MGKQVVFAEFPEWKSLSSKEKKALFQQAEQLWGKEPEKARQLFDYLWENGYDSEAFDTFAEKADGDFQYYYARKLTDILGYHTHGNLDQARHWLERAAANNCELAKKELEDDWFDGNVVEYVSAKLKKINQQIVDSFYEKHKNEVMEIFWGEEAAVLNDEGHIEFVKKEVCCWDRINGARGLILAKDEPVKREKFKMTGFSDELKAVMKTLQKKKEDGADCYPNIITYDADEGYVHGQDYEGDSFKRECEIWTILMQLLAKGYSLVEMQEYTLSNSKMLPKAFHDRIETWRRNAISALLEDANGDDDDDLDFDFDDNDEKEGKNRKPSRKKKG